MEGIKETANVEFTQLINNSTDNSMAQVDGTKIFRQMYNFTIKSGTNACDISPRENVFETVEFFDRIVEKDVVWN